MKAVSNSGLSNVSHYSGSDTLSQRKLLSYMWKSNLINTENDKSPLKKEKRNKNGSPIKVEPIAKSQENRTKGKVETTNIVTNNKVEKEVDLGDKTDESICLSDEENFKDEHFDWDLIPIYNAKLGEEIEQEIRHLKVQKQKEFREGLIQQIQEKLDQIKKKKYDNDSLNDYLSQYNENLLLKDQINSLKKLEEKQRYIEGFKENLAIYRLKKKALKNLKKKEKMPIYPLNEKKIIDEKNEKTITNRVTDMKFRNDNFEIASKRKYEIKAESIKSQIDFLDEARKYNKIIDERRSQEARKRELIKNTNMSKSELAFANYNPFAKIDQVTFLQDRLLLKQARDNHQKDKDSQNKKISNEIESKDRIQSYTQQIEDRKRLADKKIEEMKDLQLKLRDDYTNYLGRLKEQEIEKKLKMFKYRDELLMQIEEQNKRKLPNFKKQMNTEEMKLNSNLVAQVKGKLGNQRYSTNNY